MRYLKGYYLLLMAFLMACSKDDSSSDKLGNWMARSPFDGVGRSAAVCFVINDTAYIGTGYDGDDRLAGILWAYDPDINQFRQRAAFTGEGRSNAIAMSIGGKGYVGTGYNGRDRLNDFYEYDPRTDSWTRKNDFPGTKRYGAVAFSLNNKGYITTGYDGNWLKDTWEYDPAKDLFTQVDSYPGNKRSDASVFVINNRAYVMMGTSSASFVSDFFAFNGNTRKWEPLRSIDNLSDDSYDDDYNFKGSGAAAFALRGKGYIVCGNKGSLSTAVWEYTPEGDTWLQKTDFEGAARSGAVGFTVKNRGFVGLGASSSLYLDNFFEFDPTAEYEKND
ncbi:Kelch repeat-containing protein [Chitinophaga nivalis]|uniref:Galactose oxidase n=1 Tax=Chitinophaga nivalis TaxID=2991709 RepID=A0ABT3IFL4_9BACT|nr:kelch repeat-containing protein [Chitinophaga nivalis]MCW3467556.1 hypothetical protein [Chitinophaga nivalis]MCW3482752.1 hypothetical protein [Chitinophaga nivalis]